MVIDAIIENNDSESPSQDDLVEWADTYGLEIPVVADAGSGVLYSYATGGVGLPYKVLIDRGMVITHVGDATDADVEALLSEE